MGVDSNMVFDQVSKTIKVLPNIVKGTYDGEYVKNVESKRIQNGHKYYRHKNVSRAPIVDWEFSRISN